MASGKRNSARSPGNSFEHVGWGGNFRRMHSEENNNLEHTPFRPALLGQPGSRSASACRHNICVDTLLIEDTQPCKGHHA